MIAKVTAPADEAPRRATVERLGPFESRDVAAQAREAAAGRYRGQPGAYRDRLRLHLSLSVAGRPGGRLPDGARCWTKGGSRGEEPMAHIGVVGAGAWGTALAVVGPAPGTR